MQLKIILERFSGETESVLYDDFFLEDQVKNIFLHKSALYILNHQNSSIHWLYVYYMQEYGQETFLYNGIDIVFFRYFTN